MQINPQIAISKRSLGDGIEEHGQIVTRNGRDVLHGFGRRIELDKLIEGNFEDGVPNGFTRVIYKDGSYYTGEAKMGKKHGFGEFVDHDKKRFRAG